ncbi:hypothetical protein [Streptomyces cinereospinus]|uniref:hypothetical protein n=1 Tax=Streptomyces cinereospinus TaxID=285561 RepID=UPI0036244B45
MPSIMLAGSSPGVIRRGGIRPGRIPARAGADDIAGQQRDDRRQAGTQAGAARGSHAADAALLRRLAGE